MFPMSYETVAVHRSSEYRRSCTTCIVLVVLYATFVFSRRMNPTGNVDLGWTGAILLAGIETEKTTRNGRWDGSMNANVTSGDYQHT